MRAEVRDQATAIAAARVGALEEAIAACDRSNDTLEYNSADAAILSSEVCASRIRRLITHPAPQPDVAAARERTWQEEREATVEDLLGWVEFSLEVDHADAAVVVRTLKATAERIRRGDHLRCPLCKERRDGNPNCSHAFHALVPPHRRHPPRHRRGDRHQ